jgi:hypothetical protein
MALPLLTPRPNGRPSEAQELLLRAALLDGEQATDAWRRWRQVDAVATTDQDSGRLLPLVCRNLLAIGVDDPDILILKSAYRHQWVANSYRLGRAASALAALSDSGIDTIVLKGAALVERHYRDSGVRLMYDVDVLVRPEAAHRAAEALERSGWEHEVAADLDDLLPVIQGTRFANSTGAIDLHWHAMWSPAPEDDFWGAAEPAEIGGVSTLRLCPADQLLHVCVHGIWSEGERLRWVPDAITILRTTPVMDWQRVVHRARARALTLPLIDALDYLREAFGQPIPPHVLRSLREARPGARERAGHLAWRIRPFKVRVAALTLEHYRRQRLLAPAATRRASLASYLRSWAAVRWGARGRLEMLVGLVRRLVPRPIGSFRRCLGVRRRSTAGMTGPVAPRSR